MKRAIGWTIVSLVVLAGVGLSVVTLRERSQRKELEEVIVALARDGFGSSPEELRELVPADLDPALQERAWDWFNEKHNRKREEAYDYAYHWDFDWYVKGMPGPPEAVLRAQEKHRARVEALLPMLSTGRLRLTFLGWLPERFETDMQRILNATYRTPSFWKLHHVTRWLFVEALRAPDPERFLVLLDQLVEACRPVGSTMGAINARDVRQTRDRLMLVLATRNAVSDERIDAWLVEPCPARQDWAQALRCRRLVYMLPMAHALLSGVTRLQQPMEEDNVGDVAKDVAYVRWQAKRDMAKVLRSSRLVEAALRSDEAPQPLPHVDAWHQEDGRLMRWSITWFGWPYQILVERKMHRLTRLGVRLLRLARTSGLPETQEALRAALGTHATLLDAGPWDLALRYERRSETRFRLLVAPDSPVPPALEASAQALRQPRDDTEAAPDDPLIGPWRRLEMDTVFAPRNR